MYDFVRKPVKRVSMNEDVSDENVRLSSHWQIE